MSEPYGLCGTRKPSPAPVRELNSKVTVPPHRRPHCRPSPRAGSWRGPCRSTRCPSHRWGEPSAAPAATQNGDVKFKGKKTTYLRLKTEPLLHFTDWRDLSAAVIHTLPVCYFEVGGNKVLSTLLMYFSRFFRYLHLNFFFLTTFYFAFLHFYTNICTFYFLYWKNMQLLLCLKAFKRYKF